jgi:hypothetical protein
LIELIKQLQLRIHHEAYQTVQLKITPLPKSKPKIDQFREKKTQLLAAPPPRHEIFRPKYP